MWTCSHPQCQNVNAASALMFMSPVPQCPCRLCHNTHITSATMSTSTLHHAHTTNAMMATSLLQQYPRHQCCNDIAHILQQFERGDRIPVINMIDTHPPLLHDTSQSNPFNVELFTSPMPKCQCCHCPNIHAACTTMSMPRVPQYPHHRHHHAKINIAPCPHHQCHDGNLTIVKLPTSSVL